MHWWLKIQLIKRCESINIRNEVTDKFLEKGGLFRATGSIHAVKKNRLFYYLENIKSENLGFSFSLLLHLLLLLFAIGLPNFFDPQPISIPTIIPIEIINISEVTSIPKKINEIKPAEIQQKKVKEKKFNSSDIQEIQKVDIKEKPIIKIKKIEKNETPKQDIVIKEKKEIPIKLEKEKLKIDTNQVESLPTKKIKPKLKPKPNLLIEEIKKKPDVEIKPKPKPKQDPEFIIASMLKDLRNERTTQKIENEIEKKESEIIENLKEESSNENAQLTINEIDLLRQQLSSCWIAPAGSVIKKGMFVKIKANITRERRVFENIVHIHATNISKNNPFYKSITESAMRTLLHPNCTPLKLPEDKYATWKELTITLDYVLMGG